MSPNPVTILALSLWTHSRWTMVAHHTIHGGAETVNNIHDPPGNYLTSPSKSTFKSIIFLFPFGGICVSYLSKRDLEATTKWMPVAITPVRALEWAAFTVG